ncbi:MAG: hypothetical protein E7513_07905 [Ruminococcaceae bacterium]|nr:hypothetical protein [Oscillospiraceae bacterium]
MARKTKNRVQPMPKLGWKDLCLYWFIMVVCFLGAFLSVFFPIYYRVKLTQSNVNILAYEHGEGSLNCLWLAILLVAIGLIVYVELYFQRIPVFGRPNIKYGAPIYPSVYPLLMKNKSKSWKRKKAFVLKRMVVILAVLIFAVAIYPSSFYGRYELHSDGTVMVFDSQNHNVLQYTNDEIDTVCLDTKMTNVRSIITGGRWYVNLQITFNDGQSRNFSVESFGEDWVTAIEATEILKAHYGSLFFIEGTEQLQKVVRDENMSAEEEMLLFSLFEMNK